MVNMARMPLCGSPTNQPYLDLVMKLAAMEGSRLRGIAEAILDITL